MSSLAQLAIHGKNPTERGSTPDQNDKGKSKESICLSHAEMVKMLRVRDTNMGSYMGLRTRANG